MARFDVALMRTVVVQRGRAKPLWLGHPWVYADSVASIGEAEGAEPDWVRVTDADGKSLGRGLLSETSAIRVRLVEPGDGPEGTEPILHARIRAAVDLRRRLFADGRTTAYRLVHSEGDGLPGLVVDRFGPVLVAQFATRPIHRRRAGLAAALLRETGATSLLARAAGFEEEEGIPASEVAWSAGEPSPDRVEVAEEGMTLVVEPQAGQKTGHYADQRENRRLVADLCAGSRVLDLYAGTGGFSVQALRRGATSALAVESSPRAADRAEEHGRLNGVADSLRVLRADVRDALADLKTEKTLFDVVVADPPNFFPKQAGGGRGDTAAIRAYRDLNVQALTRVTEGGLVATFSCSARVSTGDLVEIVRSSARECRRRVAVLREMTAGPDHPISPWLAEGRYLTGLLLRVST